MLSCFNFVVKVMDCASWTRRIGNGVLHDVIRIGKIRKVSNGAGCHCLAGASVIPTLCRTYLFNAHTARRCTQKQAAERQRQVFF